MEELKKFGKIASAIIASLVIASCGTFGRPNYFPAWKINLVPERFTSLDVKRIGNVAARVGLVATPRKDVDKSYHGDGLKIVAIWFWPARPSMSVAAIQKDSDGTVELYFSEDMTDGRILTGENCRKYLLFQGALEAEFGRDRLKVTPAISSENCDPAKN